MTRTVGSRKKKRAGSAQDRRRRTATAASSPRDGSRNGSRNGSSNGHRSRPGAGKLVVPVSKRHASNGHGSNGRAPLARTNGDAEHAAAVKNFELAARSFRRKNFSKARELFEKLTATAPPDVADRARVHLHLCQQRLGRTGPAPKTANDFHILGISALNAGQAESAVTYLSKAHHLEPKREDIRYALAAAHALQGDAEVALEHLKAAIALRPQNRFQARHDEDFRSLSADPRFQTLVQAVAYATPRWS
jgi:tetratricopeptide (TPR) repeat protein